MTYNQKNCVRSDLVAKLLLLSGFFLCFVGAFLILPVNVLIGAVVVGFGLFDLVMSVAIPRLRDR